MLFSLYVNKTQSISDVIRDRIKELSISQADIVRRSESGGMTGINSATVSQLLSKRTLLEQITVGNLYALARGLRLKPHQILRLVEEGAPDEERTAKIARIDDFLEFLNDGDLELFLLFARAAADRENNRNAAAETSAPRLRENSPKLLKTAEKKGLKKKNYEVFREDLIETDSAEKIRIEEDDEE